jgi:hypothetical protein
MDEREIGIPPAFTAVRGATKISLSKCHLAMRRSQTLVSWFATGIFSRETLLESNEKTFCSALEEEKRGKSAVFLRPTAPAEGSARARRPRVRRATRRFRSRGRRAR